MFADIGVWDYGLAVGLISLIAFGVGTLGVWIKGWTDKFLDKSLVTFDKHSEAAMENAKASVKSAEALSAITHLINEIAKKIDSTHDSLKNGQDAIVGRIDEIQSGLSEICKNPPNKSKEHFNDKK